MWIFQGSQCVYGLRTVFQADVNDFFLRLKFSLRFLGFAYFSVQKGTLLCVFYYINTTVYFCVSLLKDSEVLAAGSFH